MNALPLPSTRLGRITALLVLSLALAFGVSVAVNASHQVAYIAAYDFSASWGIALILFIVGLLLFIPRPCRKAGVVLSSAGILVLLSFYFTICLAYGLGFTRWR